MRSSERRPIKSSAAMMGRPLLEPRTRLPGLGALLEPAVDLRAATRRCCVVIDSIPLLRYL
jgi:hypothetical protein